MVFYLLPGSGAISSACIQRRDILEAIRKGEVSFGEFSDLREKIVELYNAGRECLAPAWRRFRGRFWDELCVWALPGSIVKNIEERGIVFSPLLGPVKAGDPLPAQAVRWKEPMGSRTLKDVWGHRIKTLTARLFDGAVVFDFLRNEERELVSFPPTALRAVFEYYRKGKRVINSLAHRAYTLRYILEMEVTLEDLDRINFLDYRVIEVRKEENSLRVIMVSEGRYI